MQRFDTADAMRPCDGVHGSGRDHRERRTTVLAGRTASERGAATAELVIAAPLLLVLIFLVIQFALYLHAAHFAEAVATHRRT